MTLLKAISSDESFNILFNMEGVQV